MLGHRINNYIRLMRGSDVAIRNIACCSPNIVISPQFFPLLVFIVLSWASRDAYAQAPAADVVVMQNGDRFTGEIKILKEGKLSIKPKYTDDDVVLNWNKVDSVVTSEPFLITTVSGRHIAGRLSLLKHSGHIAPDKRPAETISQDSLVRMDQLGKSFFSSLSGGVDVGLSFARAQSQTTSTAQANLSYNSVRTIFDLASSSQVATQTSTKNTNESYLKSSYKRRLGDSAWYGGGIANFLTSSEQQVKLRTSAGGGVGHVNTGRHNSLTLTEGIVITHETDAPAATSPEPRSSLDNLVALDYSNAKFGRFTFDTSVTSYIGLTNDGRIRVTTNQNAYYTLDAGPYVRFSFYDYYDSHPTLGAPVDNYGGLVSLGWSFH
jgi:hypothetical protein